jgi:predicted membrane protein
MRRHDFDAVSFVFGLLFAAAGLVLLGAGAVRDGLALAWAGPVVAVGLAVLILVAVRPRADAQERDGDEDASES